MNIVVIAGSFLGTARVIGMPRRRDQVLDAAIAVLGSGGSRRLSHQAVDTAASVPAGTTSNYFRTRVALLDGVVGHLEALDRQDWESFATGIQPSGVDELAGALARFVAYSVGPARARTVARYSLFLEAVSRPELRQSLARTRADIHGWAVPWVRALESPTPVEHAELVADYLDGVILHQIAFPDPDADPFPAIRAVLVGLIGTVGADA